MKSRDAMYRPPFILVRGDLCHLASSLLSGLALGARARAPQAKPLHSYPHRLGLSVSHIFNASVLSCSSPSTPPAPSLPNWLW